MTGSNNKFNSKYSKGVHIYSRPGYPIKVSSTNSKLKDLLPEGQYTLYVHRSTNYSPIYTDYWMRKKLVCPSHPENQLIYNATNESTICTVCEGITLK